MCNFDLNSWQGSNLLGIKALAYQFCIREDKNSDDHFAQNSITKYLLNEVALISYN